MFDKRIRFLENTIYQTISPLTMLKYINIALHESWSEVQTTRYVWCIMSAFGVNIFLCVSFGNSYWLSIFLPVVSMLTVWSLSKQWKTKSCMQVEAKTIQLCVWESWPQKCPRDVTVTFVVLWYLLYMYIRADHSFIWQLLGCVLIFDD